MALAVTHSALAVSEKRRRRDAIEQEITLLSANINAATCQLLCLVREFDELGGWQEGGFKTCAHWLSWRTGASPGAAREKVRVARALADLPLISASFRRGEVSYSKVRAMTRIATPECEQSLLNVALYGTAFQLERLVRLYRKSGKVECERARRQQQRRYLKVHWDEHGMLVLEAKLPPEVGATVLKALEAAVEGLEQQEVAEEPAAPDVPAETPPRCEADDQPDVPAETPPRDETGESPDVPAETPPRDEADERPDIVAETFLDEDDDWEMDVDGAHARDWLVEPPLSQLGAPPEPAGAWPAEPRSQRMADALGLLARSALDAGLDIRRDAERYQVMVHVDADVLADPQQEGRCQMDHQLGVSAETARRLACDGSVVRVSEGEDGRVMDIGRRTRRISAALHRALSARDQTCSFPGCTHSRFLQAHHVEHWAEGGPTDLGNLIYLCSSCHRILHEGGFTARAEPQGGFSFYYPDGRLLEQSPPTPALPDNPVAALAERNREAGLQITDRTAAPRWEGDRLDYDWVLMWMPPPS